MSVINEALKKAALARRQDGPTQVLFEAPEAAAPSDLLREPKPAGPALSLFPILLAVTALLLAGYSAFLYQSKQAERGLRVEAETRYAKQSEVLGQKTLELETTKASLEDLSLQNAALQKTVAVQGEVIAASASNGARLTEKLRTLFKALFASRSQARQFGRESASKENTIGLLVGELSKTKEPAAAQ